MIRHRHPDVRTYVLAVAAVDQDLTLVAVGLQRADGSTEFSMQVHGVDDALALGADGALALVSAAIEVAAMGDRTEQHRGP